MVNTELAPHTANGQVFRMLSFWTQGTMLLLLTRSLSCLILWLCYSGCLVFYFVLSVYYLVVVILFVFVSVFRVLFGCLFTFVLGEKERMWSKTGRDFYFSGAITIEVSNHNFSPYLGRTQTYLHENIEVLHRITRRNIEYINFILLETRHDFGFSQDKLLLSQGVGFPNDRNDINFILKTDRGREWWWNCAGYTYISPLEESELVQEGWHLKIMENVIITNFVAHFIKQIFATNLSPSSYCTSAPSLQAPLHRLFILSYLAQLILFGWNYINSVMSCISYSSSSIKTKRIYMTVGTTFPCKILNNGKEPCEPLMTSSFAHHS